MSNHDQINRQFVDSMDDAEHTSINCSSFFRFFTFDRIVRRNVILLLLQNDSIILLSIIPAACLTIFFTLKETIE